MDWYEDEVKRVEEEKRKLSYTPRVVFYGSSSINLWPEIYVNFRAFDPVNLGFGGSTLESCVWYFERILTGLEPEHILCYAGDNDLGDGKTAEEVILYFQQLMDLLKKHFPAAMFSFISIKPSTARWHLIDKIKKVNQHAEETLKKAGNNYYYVDIFDRMLGKDGKPVVDLLQQDGLHLSARGYALWQEILLTHLHETRVS
ncbi:MAG: GDSL family lipase [Chitinophagaceae bacterium]|nr:GDSL family lipase [Chitinophagaceae bacterium]